MGRRLAGAVLAGALAIGSAALLTAAAPVSAAPPPDGATVVGAANPTTCPNPSFSTIQAAVTAASAGDTIFVCPGSYPENVSITKDVTLLGPQFQTPADATNRTDTTAEATIAPTSGNAITYSGAGTTGTVSGLTIAGSGEGIFAITNGSGYTWTNNVITGESTGIHFAAASTTITGNRFSGDDVPDNGTGGIFLSNGASNDLTITNNAFAGNATDINTTGSGVAGDLSDGLVVSDNTSDGSGNFIALFLSDAAKISNNTVTDSTESAFFVGGGNTGVTITGNTISGGAATGINVVSQFFVGSPNQVSMIASNTITGRTDGIRIQPNTEQSASSTIADNVVRNSSNNGIWLQSGTGITVSGNRSLDSGSNDCVDQTSGAGTAGTANTWTGDIGRTSDPAGLCTAVKPTITSGNPPNGTVGKAYRFTVTATGSPEITFTVSAGSLPPGLSLGQATISGTPTKAGTYTFTITATNEFGSDSASYTVTIAAAPTPPSPTAPPTATSTSPLSPPAAGGGNLADTGARAGGLLGLAMLLLVAGSGLLLLARRRGPGH